MNINNDFTNFGYPKPHLRSLASCGLAPPPGPFPGSLPGQIVLGADHSLNLRLGDLEVSSWRPFRFFPKHLCQALLAMARYWYWQWTTMQTEMKWIAMQCMAMYGNGWPCHPMVCRTMSWHVQSCHGMLCHGSYGTPYHVMAWHGMPGPGGHHRGIGRAV